MHFHTRKALTAALLSTALVAALTAPSFADKKSDLEQQRKAASGAAQDAKKHLDASTKEFADATAALQAAQAELDTAQATLGETRGKVAVAAALDTEMQGKLDQTQADLVAAKAELDQGLKRLTKSERSVEEYAVQDYLDGDRGLRAVSGLLKGEDPSTYGERVSLNDAVSDDQLATMQKLDATRVILKLNRQKVQKLRDKVKVQREQAAANLSQKQQLEAAAQDQAVQVAGLVTDREAAKVTAASAQAEDDRLYQEQLAETSRVENELKALAAEELRKAREKAAREKAAREQAAREQAAREKAARDKGSSSAPSAPSVPSVPSEPDTGDSDGTLSKPLSGPITSSYGMRKHPITGVYKLHDGTDFGVPCGTPVKAAASGTVISQYYNGAYGNRVLLNNGVKRGVSVVTIYNHLSRFVVKPGAKVKRGQLIAYSGTTGYSTGCHLHFMVLANGSTVNPMGWL